MKTKVVLLNKLLNSILKEDSILNKKLGYMLERLRELKAYDAMNTIDKDYAIYNYEEMRYYKITKEEYEIRNRIYEETVCFYEKNKWRQGN